MDYSDTALRTIRAALLEFRAATRRNAAKRSWRIIAEEIDEEHIQRHDVQSDKALAEALRRFAAGTQTPAGDRLDVISRYLIDRRFLSPGDLKDAPSEPVLVRALEEFFGADDGDAATETPLQALYAGSRKVGKRTELSLLKIEKEEGGRFAVEERLYSLPVPPVSYQHEALMRMLKRVGGSETRFRGWLIRTRGQHCVFARDDLSREASVHLIARLAADGEGQPPAELTILKSRDFGNPAPGYARESMVLLSKSDNPDRQRFAGIIDNVWFYRRQETPDG